MYSRLRNWFSLDTRTLALARIAFGIFIFIDLVTRFQYVEWHYADSGLVSLDVWFKKVRWAGSFSLFVLNGSVAWASLLLIFHMLVSLLMAIGWRTTCMTALNTILLVSLHDRNPFILNSGDKIALVMVSLAIFLPWGEFFSLDQKRKGITKPRLVSGSWVGCFYLVAFLIYFVSACFKIQTPKWIDLTALFYVFNGNEKITYVAGRFGQFPGLLEIATASVIVLHIAVVQILLFGWLFPRRWEKKIKLYLCGSFAIFHFFTIVLFVGLGVFPFYCISFWLAILPSDMWRNAASHLDSPRSIGWEVLGLWQLFIILFFQLSLIKPFGLEFASWKDMAKWTRMAQYWTMFQEAEPGRLRWLTYGVLANGEIVDLTLAEIPNGHWSKLHGNMVKMKFLRRYYLSAVCRHSEISAQLVSVELKLHTSALPGLGQPYTNEGVELVDRLDCENERGI